MTRAIAQDNVLDDQIAASTYSLLLYKTTPSRCSGSLIAPNIILTAAHCVVDTAIEKIFLDYFSEKDQAYLPISTLKVKIHPEYKNEKSLVLADVALVYLNQDVPGGRPAFLPDSNFKFYQGQSLWMAGFGSRSENILDRARLKNNPRAETLIKIFQNKKSKLEDVDRAAAELYMTMSRAPLLITNLTGSLQSVYNSEKKLSYALFLSNTQDHSICHGDSGGPSYIFDTKSQRLVLVGVHSKSTNADCKSSTINNYGVDVYVPLYVDWIRAGLSKNSAIDNPNQKTPMKKSSAPVVN